MTAPGRSLRQEIDLLWQRFDGLGPAVQVSFNKLKDQIQTLEQRTHALEQQTLALKEQNRVLEERVNAVEEENRTLRAAEADSELSSEMPLMNRTWARESTLEDITPDHSLGDASSEYNSESGFPVRLSSPVNKQTSATLKTTKDDDKTFVVWYENGTLTTNAPKHVLDTQDWRDFLAAFAKTHTFLTEKNDEWHLTTKTNVCVRDVVQKSKDSKSMQWTVASPGKFCCKRCLNTQRVCLKYNEESERLEALPLPEKVRPEGAPFGIKWFVAEQPDASRKAGFKGLWMIN
ncbi:hypothetical protein KCU93_g6841, partial [Aureobasidium melanogenum]